MMYATTATYDGRDVQIAVRYETTTTVSSGPWRQVVTVFLPAVDDAEPSEDHFGPTLNGKHYDAIGESRRLARVTDRELEHENPPPVRVRADERPWLVHRQRCAGRAGKRLEAA